jgi:transcriptional regulator with XRE-family HTH domain
MDIDTINSLTVSAILQKLANRVKQRRLELNLSQKDFAKKTGVGYDTYRKFEITGEITLQNLVLCATVLGETDAFNELFSQAKYQSIQDVIKEKNKKKRQRASKL